MKLAQFLKRYLIAGLLVVIPISLTFLVIGWFVSFIDGITAPLFARLFGHKIPGMGLISAVIALIVIGFITSYVPGQRFFNFWESIILRIPVLSWVYKTIKQIVDAFSPESNHSFKSVVIVEYPRQGSFSLGFVTKELALDRPESNGESFIAVYIPTNHVYLGDYVLFHKQDVIFTTLSVQEGIKCALSAGATLPDHIALLKNKAIF